MPLAGCEDATVVFVCCVVLGRAELGALLVAVVPVCVVDWFGCVALGLAELTGLLLDVV